MNNTLPQNICSFIGHFLNPYKYIVLLYVTIAIVAGCCGPFNSLLIKYLINLLSSLHTDNMALLAWPAALLILNFIVFENFTLRLIGYLNYRFQPKIKNKIIGETFAFVIGSSPQFFHDNLSGGISSKITTLADNIERILHNVASDFIRGFALLLFSLITMYYVNSMFFYTLATWLVAFASVSIIMSKRLVNLSDIHTASESYISGQLVDGIANANNIGIFARRFYEVSRLENSLLVAKNKFQTKEMFLLMMHSVQGTLIAIMLGFMAYFLIYLYGKNAISMGDFALILGLSMEVGHMTWYTMYLVDDFNQAVGKCKQSLGSLMVPQEIIDKKDAKDLLITKGQIAFENVKFQYKGAKPIFQDKSVIIEAGQKVGFVGYSGGGKSTFVNLILRLYDVTDGKIFIDGQDIREVTQDSLRNNIAMIPQDPSLFNRTLMENIRYGDIQSTDEEVIESAKKAYAHEFIMNLSQGYDSPVGERGVKLSGGQRQRIAIARAILKNAPILILDEATSQLDSVTENSIQKSLFWLMQGKTTIVIAHRLSTLLQMDRILVFEHGKIVQDGTHTELLNYGGLYKTLWDTQVGGFFIDKKGDI